MLEYNRIRAAAQNAEFYVLCALVFVLPTLETFKTILALVFVVTWLVGHYGGAREEVYSGAKLVGYSVLFLIFAAAVSTAINWPMQSGLKGLKDTLFYSGVFLCLYRNGYSAKQKNIIAFCIVAGVLAGLLWGLVDVHSGKKVWLELRSVGIVTQSSIYLGMAIIIAFAMMVQGTAKEIAPQIFWAVSFGIMTIALFFMASRGAIVATFAALLLIVFCFRSWKFLLSAVLVMIVALALLVSSPDWMQQQRIVTKIQHYAQTWEIDANDNLRFTMWRIAAEQFMYGGAMMFGIGPRNFPCIDISKLPLRDVTIQGKMCDHAHNLFLNKLVEEGIVGFIAMSLFFAVVVAALVADFRKKRHGGWTWCAAVGAVVIPVIAGSFNTPWKQEHALLAMILIALFYASRGPKASANHAETRHI